jgi:hypothetical protein
MVSPINGDKPITATAERSGESTKSSRGDQAASGPSNTLEHKAAKPVGATLEVDKARQLYDLESQKSRGTGQAIESPEAARSLLQEILEQFSAMPEQAVKSQGSQPAALANLLLSAPA